MLEAERRRRMRLDLLAPEVQACRGQYFRPARAAEMMAALPRDPGTGKVRILDPGAGTGMLSVAMVQRLLAGHGTAPARRPSRGATARHGSLRRSPCWR